MQLKVEIDTVNLSKFKEQFKELTGNQPFNWQEELYNRFINGSFPEECVVPTGLGKTSVIAIWLLALGNSLSNGEKPRKIPLRLVYVVDRRVIVDQSTDEAMNYINKLSDIEKQPNNHPLSPIAKAFRDLAFLKEGPVVVISTLRGQLAENREWCIDPSRPAIIIGTVDMIGSRLLFSGYGGLGRSHLSLQAGLLATDSLLLIDEAHLSPAFVNTIRQMHRFTKDSKIKPSLNIMFLSATIPSKNEGLQENSKSKFEIDIEKECCNVEAKNRLLAKKIIEFEYFNQLQSEGKKPTDKEIEEELAKTIVKKAVEYKDNKVSVIIFVSTVSLVNMVGDKLIKELGEGDESRILKMTGEMRGYERDKLVENDKFKIFLPSRDRSKKTPTHYLIATSCAEVGVNIDADHGICDLTSLDSMIQRIGRINRFGKCESKISIFVNKTELDITYIIDEKKNKIEKKITNIQSEIKEIEEKIKICSKKEKKELKQNLRDKKDELKNLNKEMKKLNKEKSEIDIESKQRYYTWKSLNDSKNEDGIIDASPKSLRKINEPRGWPEPPVCPVVDIAKLDDWSMTSLRHNEYPKSLATYWLRGVMNDKTPQTIFCWRADLNYANTSTDAEEMAEIIPVYPNERATLATYRAVKFLEAIAKNFPETFIVLIDATGKYQGVSLKELPTVSEDLFSMLVYSTVIFPTKVGGLSEDGNVLEKPAKKQKIVNDVVDEKEWKRYIIRKVTDLNYECRILKCDGNEGEASNYSSISDALKKCVGEDGWVCVNASSIRNNFTKTIDEDENEDIDSEESSSESSKVQIAYFLNKKSVQRVFRDNDDLASIGMKQSQTIEEHNAKVDEYVTNISKKIGLDNNLIRALSLAAKFHDCGKNRDWWQAAIGNPRSNNVDWKPIAKTRSEEFDFERNSNYRHEFGSVIDVENSKLLNNEPENIKELVLHLIAAHHGYGRPHFPTKAFDRNYPMKKCEAIVDLMMNRFIRLQREYGWWQLAYLEALLKSADALATRHFIEGKL